MKGKGRLSIRIHLSLLLHCRAVCPATSYSCDHTLLACHDGLYLQMLSQGKRSKLIFLSTGNIKCKMQKEKISSAPSMAQFFLKNHCLQFFFYHLCKIPERVQPFHRNYLASTGNPLHTNVKSFL